MSIVWDINICVEWRITLHNAFLLPQAFQHDLGKRQESVSAVNKAAGELMKKSDEDKTHLESQLLELGTKWDRICRLSVSKQERLQKALTEVGGNGMCGHGWD